MAHAELCEVIEEAKDLEEPEDDGDDDDAVEDALNLALHGDVTIDEKQQQSNNSQRENDINEGHLVLSDPGAGTMGRQIIVSRDGVRALDYIGIPGRAA